MNCRSIHIVSSPSGSLGEIVNDLMVYLKDKFNFTSELDKNNCIPEKYEILLSHFISEKIVNSPIFYKFKYKVLIQPIDGTKIYSQFVEAMNKYDLILTPGKAGKRIMEENGVTTEILIIPNFYKPEILIKPKNLSIPKLDKFIANKFVFYHESTGHPRKGIEEMCESYVKAFSDTPYADKVILIFKASQHNALTYDDLEGIKKRIIKLQKQYKKPASIIKISQQLSEETLKKLWYKTDCYLHFAKIEGFGIPLLRMTVLNKPIITLYNKDSGYMDYLINKENVIFLADKKVIAHNEFIPIYTKETEWSVPICKAESSKKLIDVFLNKKEFKNKGGQTFLKKYSVNTIMHIYETIFNSISMYKKSNWGFIESDVKLI